MRNVFFAALILSVISGCKPPEKAQTKSLDDIANQYVKLALEIGQYNPDFIDAYYGPENWNPKKQVRKALPYEELKWQTTALINQLGSIDDMSFEEVELLRYQFLVKQLQAVRTKLDMLSGKEYPFDVESLRLYDVVAPHTDLVVYDSLLNELDNALPGEGTIADRYVAFSSEFIIPPDKLDIVFSAAIDEARKRVKQHIEMPEEENFEVEYVTNKPWSGYNWYKGKSYSLIQINTDLPICIDRAIDLACHEGYPGHHLYNVLLEQKLVKGRHWNEYQVYPLFTPQSFIAEGSAQYGIEITFSKEDRFEYERDVLFPLAGLNPTRIDEYYEVQSIRKELMHAINDIARMYINREIDPETTVEHLVKYLQYTNERAQKKLAFFDRYRSYVINYSQGEEFIRQHIEDEVADGKTKWKAFEEIISTPRSASTL
ncbi:MAG: hypothetical protein ABFS32_09955 [Bacteroidota bacterium]